MRGLLARRPSPAMAVAFVALLAALSGTAVALPGVNVVDSGDIRNNSVRSNDLRNNNVLSRDIRNGGVAGRDVRDNTLTGTDVNEGTLGQVPSAATAGSANTAATANSLASGDVNSATVVNPANTLTLVEANCDPGLKGVSAGLRVQNPENQFLVDIYPVDLDTWAAHVDNDGTGGTATLLVICGAINSVTGP